LLKEELVDEIKLLVYPVVLGAGKKLFADGTNVKLKLTECKNFATGLIALHYAI
jgi:dihydrofolate reductase